MRTKEQLGYIVMCLTDDNRGVLGMSILLQSALKASYELISYIDNFIDKILIDKLKELDEHTFGEFKILSGSVRRKRTKTFPSKVLVSGAKLFVILTCSTENKNKLKFWRRSHSNSSKSN